VEAAKEKLMVLLAVHPDQHRMEVTMGMGIVRWKIREARTGVSFEEAEVVPWYLHQMAKHDTATVS
jgi:hypothetical protein